jgi:hypothetical protein
VDGLLGPATAGLAEYQSANGLYATERSTSRRCPVSLS